MTTDVIESDYLALRNEAELSSFRAVALSMLMEKSTVEDERSANGDYLEVWRTPDGKRRMSWIEVPRVFGRFVWYQGTDVEQSLQFAARMLPSASSSEVREMLRSPDVPHDERVALLHIAAYVTPSERPDLLETFRRHLADSHRGIRLAAVRGYTIRRWPGLLDEIERISQEDPEDDIREFAAKTVKLVREEQRGNQT
ncbi:MAG: hypothetical protein HOV81_21300 [Kofleriaceae bacterium]|nr:hypothetical protein [Kofleriaceae bacterium]